MDTNTQQSRQQGQPAPHTIETPRALWVKPGEPLVPAAVREGLLAGDVVGGRPGAHAAALLNFWMEAATSSHRLRLLCRMATRRVDLRHRYSRQETDRRFAPPGRGVCWACGRTHDLEWHAVIRREHGGRHVLGNQVPLCGRCADVVDSWGKPQPKAPRTGLVARPTDMTRRLVRP
jgi:hypothetical protein